MNLDLRLNTSGDYYARKFQPTQREDTLILNMGPQHPSTHGVLRVLLEIDGEYIVRAEPVLGYIHRMHEKMAEVRTYVQYLPNMGRADYLHALAWNWAYVGAVERLMGIDVPERAEFIRVITCELNRINSHLLWWGAYLLDLGAFTPIMYAFADRERVMDILQRITGARLTYCYYRFGGVSADIDDRFITEVREFCLDMEERLKLFKSLVTDNIILRKRVEDIGHIDAETCRLYGATGPVLRGSGIEYDIRRAEPYSVYHRFDFKVPTYDEGDAMARYMVRMEEIEESINIITQALDALPQGQHINPLAPRRPCPPKGDIYFAVESGRGKVGIHLVSHGGESPYRLKLRAPSFSNLSLFAEVSAGTLLSDAVSILGSLDLVIPEIDR
ncbi:NADH-quinone oxidoreductase subunit D [Desulfonatronovibrio hydrogenovorans]|uniref:NADH-quinone oxidoreductase subunit D n=1 Tax=Desulfonatronovibrio hydrogenovorans TaxID=53245 RepID=UPI000491F756|nr:NADH-quinone oxidoreductase subunit D [Desulfonatronovibrio hydrogenovorans]